jgi:hypothetical protein
MQYSYKVLSDYGNMSSPTILFVLNEIMQAENTDGETIFSIGFGPGLSIETALLTYVTNESEKSNTNETADSKKLIARLSSGREVVSIL